MGNRNVPNCVFCQIAAKKIPAHIVYEDPFFLAFLDIHPRTRGHMQLIPKKHVRWVYDIREIGSFFERAQYIIHGIIPILGASHVTMATFGQEVAHAHLWIVPHYSVQDDSVSESSAVRAEEDPGQLAAIMRSVLVKEVFS